VLLLGNEEGLCSGVLATVGCSRIENNVQVLWEQSSLNPVLEKELKKALNFIFLMKDKKLFCVTIKVRRPYNSYYNEQDAKFPPFKFYKHNFIPPLITVSYELHGLL
jgi:hypothetical protein